MRETHTYTHCRIQWLSEPDLALQSRMSIIQCKKQKETEWFYGIQSLKKTKTEAKAISSIQSNILHFPPFVYQFSISLMGRGEAAANPSRPHLAGQRWGTPWAGHRSIVVSYLYWGGFQ